MKKTILTIDDSESILAVVSTTLDEEYNVITACDGEDAMDKLKSDLSIDLIITDLNMPKADGIKVIRFARALPKFAMTPILMLTTESQVQKKQEAKEAGATGWIVKPFEPDNLKAVVKKVMR